MIAYKVYSSIFRLRKIWNDLFSKGQFTPYSSYDYTKLYCILYYLRRKHWAYCFRFFYFYEEEKASIWALLINKKTGIVYDITHDSPMDYYDIISNTKDTVFHRLCLDRIFEVFHGYSFCFENIREKGVLISVLPDNLKTEPCVHIDLSTYDNWHNRLSKHQRQNIRTAYNRLSRDSLSITVNKFDAASNPNIKSWVQCLIMYEERSLHKLYHNGGSISFLGRLNRYKNMLASASNISLLMMPERLIYILYCNKTPVSYLAGFYNSTDRVFYVSRLSCSNDWLKYDMGIILIDRVIQDLTDNMGIICMDLTRGNEAYKISMGGTPHFNYIAEITRH